MKAIKSVGWCVPTRVFAILIFLVMSFLVPTLSFAEEVGRVSRVIGRVDVLKAGSTATVPARQGDGVSMGDIIRTKSDGKVEILFRDDTTITVAPETRLKIDEYTFNPDNSRSKGILSIFRGKIRAAVSKAKGGLMPVSIGSSTFNINTPTTVAGVRGTVLFVFYERGITGVVFKEGDGFVYNKNMPDRMVNVSAGQATFILKGNAPPLPPRPASDVEMTRHIKDTTIKETNPNNNAIDNNDIDNNHTDTEQTETTQADTADTMTTLGQTGGEDTSAPKTINTEVDPDTLPPVLPITETDTETLKETIPPLITITSSPQAITNSSSGSFTITADEPVTFTYNLDGTTVASASLTGLTEGPHTFVVTATDAAGNVSTSSYSWTTDYTAPVATLTTSALPDAGDSATVNIALSSNETSTYAYNLDGSAVSTTNLAGLSEGNHTFTVTVTDSAGNSSTNTLSFFLSRYSLAGNVRSKSGWISGSATSGEFAGISNQDWGGWINTLTGTYTSMPSTFTLKAGGGRRTNTVTSNNGGYWLDIITGASNGISTLSGTSSLKYLSLDRLGTGTGVLTGSYDAAGNWVATDTGTYTETPLAWSGRTGYDRNDYGLYYSNVDGIWGAGNTYGGLAGGTQFPWSGTTSLTLMGLMGPSSSFPSYIDQFLWNAPIYSYNQNNSTYTTYDGGAFWGLIGGVWKNDGTIDARVYSLYIDPSGNAGILKGSVTGEYYPRLSMFEADGTWTPTLLAIGLTPASLGSLTYSPDIDLSYSTSNSGVFTAGGSVNGNYAQVLKYSIPGQDWGVWQILESGAYSGGTSDTWNLSLNPANVVIGNDQNIIYGTQTDGSQWSNSVLAGQTYGYGADITTTPTTWISVGETIGTFDAAASTWQAVQTGAWFDTNKFLSMRGTPEGQAALTQLNIPFVEVGKATLSGSGNNFTTLSMIDTTFFAYSNDAAPKIWATGNVSGNYTAPPVLNTAVTLTGSGLSADFNVQQWNTTNSNWMATVNGGGTYSGTGTMNGTSVQMTGASAGRGATASSGSITGTGSGVAK